MARFSAITLIICAFFAAGWLSRGYYEHQLTVSQMASIGQPTLRLPVFEEKQEEKQEENKALSKVKGDSVKKENKQSIDVFIDFLLGEQYQQAVQFYTESIWGAPLDMSENFHAAFLLFLDESYRDHQYQNIIQAAKLFLVEYPADYQVAAFYSQALAGVNQIEEAISALYAVVDYAPDQEEKAKALEFIHNLVLKKYSQLKDGSKWIELEIFYRYLLTQENIYFPYYLYYASVLMKLENYDSAETYLEPLLQESDLKEVASHMLDRLHLLQKGGSIFPLVKMGSHYVGQVSFNAQTTANLLLDTGASYSTISPAVFNNIPSNQVSLLERGVNLNTANGLVSAKIYQINNLRIGKYELHDIEFAVLPLGSDGVDGLLGMNILQRFHFELDQINAELILQPQ